MPLLRLQQPCPRADRPGALARRVARRPRPHAARTPGARLTSIFFGGGTPSLMPPATAAALIERVEAHLELRRRYRRSRSRPIPASVEAARFAALPRAGVNRVSLGVQSLDDGALRFLGRHARPRRGDGGGRARRDVVRPLLLRSDLRPARPDAAAWGASSTRRSSWHGDHLSLYQLTIEPGTRFHARAGSASSRCPTTRSRRRSTRRPQEMARRPPACPAYEISNHAAPGEESRHNLAYWRYGDYVGVGPGAHGRRRRRGQDGDAPAAPARKLARRNRPAGHGTDEGSGRPERRRDEVLLMGLRLAEGVHPTASRGRRPTRRPWRGSRLDRGGLLELRRRAPSRHAARPPGAQRDAGRAIA